MPDIAGSPLGTAIRATAPWIGPSRSHHGDCRTTSRMHYRGWTLVDTGKWRYAAKDNTLRRIRVCRTNTNRTDALRRFHEIVDREEGES